MVEMVPQIPGQQLLDGEEQAEASIIKLPKMA